MNKNQVVIIGGDHHNTLGLIRSLGIKGIRPDVIQMGAFIDGYIKYSRYVGRVYECNQEEDVVKCLLCNYKNTLPTIILTSSDEAAFVIDKQYEELNESFIIPNAKGNLCDYIDKQIMCEIAESVGFNVPQHIIYSKGDEFPHNIEYPCITKAISSIMGGKSDTKVCYKEEELRLFISNDNLCKTIQIEKFINKEIEFQLFGLSLNSGNEIIIPGHSHIYRPGIQNEFYFPYIENDESFIDTLEKTKAFIKRTQYSGLFSVEFLRGKDGNDYFLEMNFRNDGNAICVTDAGYNLPYIWCLYNSGEDYKEEIKKSSFKKVYFCPDIIYFNHFLSGEIGFIEWLRTRIKSNSFTTKYKGDNKPYRKGVRNLLHNMWLIVRYKIIKK